MKIYVLTIIGLMLSASMCLNDENVKKEVNMSEKSNFSDNYVQTFNDSNNDSFSEFYDNNSKNITCEICSNERCIDYTIEQAKDVCFYGYGFSSDCPKELIENVTNGKSCKDEDGCPVCSDFGCSRCDRDVKVQPVCSNGSLIDNIAKCNIITLKERKQISESEVDYLYYSYDEYIKNVKEDFKYLIYDENDPYTNKDIHSYGSQYNSRSNGSIFGLVYRRNVEDGFNNDFSFWAVEIDSETGELLKYKELGNLWIWFFI